MRVTRLPLILLSVIALAAAACSAAPQVDVSNAQLIVELRDYSVKPSVGSIRAGKVTIGVRNLAGMAHDLTVLKTDTAVDKLPIDPAYFLASCQSNEWARARTTNAVVAPRMWR